MPPRPLTRPPWPGKRQSYPPRSGTPRSARRPSRRDRPPPPRCLRRRGAGPARGRARRSQALAELDRTSGARRSELDAAGTEVRVDPPAQPGVKLLGALDVRHREDDTSSAMSTLRPLDVPYASPISVVLIPASPGWCLLPPKTVAPVPVASRPSNPLVGPWTPGRTRGSDGCGRGAREPRSASRRRTAPSAS